MRMGVQLRRNPFENTLAGTAGPQELSNDITMNYNTMTFNGATSQLQPPSKKKVINQQSVYDSTLSMMYQSQTLFS